MSEDALLVEMEELATSVSWHGHLPYEAALHFHDQSEIREIYRSHVDDCDYCQRLINVLHPADRNAAPGPQPSETKAE